MSDVTCAGSEPSLDQCLFNGWGINNCVHRDDAGVVCQGREWCVLHVHVLYSISSKSLNIPADAYSRAMHQSVGNNACCAISTIC